MRVRTCCTIDAPPQVVWPLLCDSAMESPTPLLFWLGIPRPRRCRLPSGVGGVGQPRQCVSDKGSIQQRILQWEECRRLRFEMEHTDLFFRGHVRAVMDTFDIEEPAPGTTRLTRTTELALAGRFQNIKAAAVWFGLKLVQRYVFKNWAMLARRSVAA